MLRTKNEAMEKAEKSQGEGNFAYVRIKCGDHVSGDGNYEAYSSCIEAARRERKASRKQVLLSQVFYENWTLKDKALDDPKAIGFSKLALKVFQDMKKAGCPYE